MRVKFKMVCSVCKMENYSSKKNKSKHPEVQEYKKFCPKCNLQVVHKEKRK